MDQLTEYGYRVEADPAKWVPVPKRFPFGEWDDEAAWTSDVPERLAAGADDAEELAGWYRTLASAVLKVPDPHPGVVDTFWWLPIDREETTLAHLTVVPRSELGEATLADVASTGSETVSLPVVEELQSRVFGTVARSLEMIPVRIGDRPDGEPEVGVLGVVRLAAESHDAVFLLEVIDPSLDMIALMLDDLLALLDSVRIGTVDELESAE